MNQTDQQPNDAFTFSEKEVDDIMKAIAAHTEAIVKSIFGKRLPFATVVFMDRMIDGVERRNVPQMVTNGTGQDMSRVLHQVANDLRRKRKAPREDGRQLH